MTTPEQAHAVGRLLRALPGAGESDPPESNSGYDGLPSDRTARGGFRTFSPLRPASTVRQRRGIDIAAGCGQLQPRRRGRRGKSQRPIAESQGSEYDAQPHSWAVPLLMNDVPNRMVVGRGLSP